MVRGVDVPRDSRLGADVKEKIQFHSYSNQTEILAAIYEEAFDTNVKLQALFEVGEAQLASLKKIESASASPNVATSIAFKMGKPIDKQGGD